MTYIDSFDRKILKVISNNGRISMVELGHRVGLSKTPVTARVKRLEEAGYTKGYASEFTDKPLN